MCMGQRHAHGGQPPQKNPEGGIEYFHLLSVYNMLYGHLIHKSGKV